MEAHTAALPAADVLVGERPSQHPRRTATRLDARRRLQRRLLAYADVGAAALALALAISTLGDDGLRLPLFLSLPIVVLAGKVQGLYDRDELLLRKTTVDEAPQLFRLATLYTLVLWLLSPQLIDGQLGQTQVLTLWGLFLVFTVLARRSARWLTRRWTTPERCLFVGDASAYDRLRSKLDDSKVNAEMVGRLSLQRVTRRGVRNANLEDLQALVGWTDAERLVIESQALPDDEMLDFVRTAKACGVTVSVLPRVFDVIGSSVVFDDLHGMTMLGIRRFGLSRSSQLLKRAFDVAGSGIGLLAASPLLAVLALAIKLTSPGPVLFRQTRVGRDGRHFRICKFRTMCVDAEQRKAELRDRNEAGDGLFKIADDPRVTRVGRLLRRTSLDELPQLFNVFAGDMSLVGPRPLVLDEDEQITGWDRRRLELTPGMTGHWQILGSARVPLAEMVKIDYLYVANWSLWSDIKLLVRTVPYMLSRGGM